MSALEIAKQAREFIDAARRDGVRFIPVEVGALEALVNGATTAFIDEVSVDTTDGRVVLQARDIETKLVVSLPLTDEAVKQLIEGVAGIGLAAKVKLYRAKIKAIRDECGGEFVANDDEVYAIAAAVLR